MSRDWTPRDKYHIDQWYIKNKGISLAAIINSMRFTSQDNPEPIPLVSEEEISHQSQLPTT